MPLYGRQWPEHHNYVIFKYLNLSLFPLQVIFEAKRSNGYKGDIALDDIEFLNCQPLDITKKCTADQFQ